MIENSRYKLSIDHHPTQRGYLSPALTVHNV